MVCSRCQTEVSTEGLAPGTLVSCPNCQGLVGRSRPPSIKINVPGADPAPPRGRTTRSVPKHTTSREERPRPSARPNYTNYIIWGVMAIGLAIGGYFVLKSVGKGGEPMAKKTPKPAQPDPEPPPLPPPPPLIPPPKPVVEEKPKVKMIKFRGKEYPVPAEFTGGAEKISAKFPPPGVVAIDAQNALKSLEKGDFESLLKRPWETFLPVMANSLTDNEKVAHAAFEYLDRIGVKYKLPGMIKDEVFHVQWDFFTDPASRSATFSQFMDFYPALQGYWEKEKIGMDPLSTESIMAKDANWDKLIVDLAGYQMTMEKGSESKYTYEDNPENPGKAAFEKVKRMGKQAYPFLVRFILDEDPSRMRTSVVVLHMLTGYPPRIPKPSEARKAFQEWLDNLGLTEDKIPK